MVRADILLTPIVRQLGIEPGVLLERIKTDWDKIFDKPLVLHMSPSKFSNGELLVNAESPMWIQQLSYCQNDILKKLDVYGVRSLRFRLGRVSQKRPPADEQTDLKLSNEDASFITELVSGIDDDRLKAAIRNAAEKSFSQKKRSKPESRQ